MKVALVAASRLIKVCVAQALEQLAISMFTIDNTADVYTRVRAEHPDVLLLQMDLPGLDIAQISRLIKATAETRNTFIAVLSTTAEVEKEALDAGASGFILFPFAENALAQLIAGSKVGRKKILLADDAKVIHEYIKIILKDEPYDLFHAYNGVEALALLPSVKPDLLITDLEMPEMGGYELCSRTKNHPDFSRIPVIISSTRGEGVEIDKGFDAGADDYLVKPVDGDELINKLRAMLYSEIKKQRDHLLVIDDSKVILSLVGNALELQGFRVTTAMRGDEGVRIAKSIKPALVITDCEMPGLNGRDVARELRAIPEFKYLPIIMLTAKEEQVEKAKARRAGVSDFVSKPFPAEKIIVIVERLIAEAKMLRERDAMMSYMSDAAIKQASDRARQGSDGKMTAYRDHAAILFSDVCGFTTMSETRSPEAIISLLNSYFDEMVQIIVQNKGTIDKFIGDAIMAIFYGKSAEENAYLAVKSGYEMILKLKEINAKKADDHEHVHIRIGINSGDVIFGDLGSRISRRDFTVIGDNVNTAQRLESKAPKDHVLISDSTYLLIKDQVEIERSENLNLKGKSNILLCHVLSRVLPAPTKQTG